METLALSDLQVEHITGTIQSAISLSAKPDYINIDLRSFLRDKAEENQRSQLLVRRGAQ